MVCTLVTPHGAPSSKWSQTIRITLTHNSRYCPHIICPDDLLFWINYQVVFSWRYSHVQFKKKNLPVSGVAGYLGSPCGQCASEPCQLGDVQLNAHSMTHSANMKNTNWRLWPNNTKENRNAYNMLSFSGDLAVQSWVWITEVSWHHSLMCLFQTKRGNWARAVSWWCKQTCAYLFNRIHSLHSLAILT